MAISLCSGTAFADDFCSGDVLSYRLEDQKYTFWIAEVPRFEFTELKSCDPSKECKYRIDSTEFGTTRVIVDSLSIGDICNAFKRTQAEKENPYFQSSNDTLFAYKRKREVIYRASTRELLLEILVSQYFDGPGDESWGSWEGDEYSGIMTSLGVETVEIFIGNPN